MKVGWDCIGIAVEFFCHDGAGKFLLHKRSDKCRDEHGRWDFGGGKVEFGEGVRSALFREVNEEYCTFPKWVHPLYPYDFLREQEGHKDHWVVFPFFVGVDPKTVRVGEPAKMTEIGWFTLGELPRPQHSAIEIVLTEYEEEFDFYGRESR